MFFRLVHLFWAGREGRIGEAPERREKERSLYSMEFIPLWVTVATPDERGVPYSMTLTTYEH